MICSTLDLFESLSGLKSFVVAKYPRSRRLPPGADSGLGRAYLTLWMILLSLYPPPAKGPPLTVGSDGLGLVLSLFDKDSVCVHHRLHAK